MAVLRVATFNLLHGMALPAAVDVSTERMPLTSESAPTPDGVSSAALAAAAAVLDADVIGLQEVDRGQERSGHVDQTEVVARAVGAAHWQFVPALHGVPGGPDGWRAATETAVETPGPSYGIGLVSRLPVLSWHVRRFAAAPFALPLLVPGGSRLVRVRDEPRAACAAVVAPVGRRPFTVATAHLSFVPGFNAHQLRAITRWLADLPGPRLLLGDFNLPGGLPKALTGWCQLGRVPTYPSYRPRVQFDHVLADGLDGTAVRRVAALPLAISDHCALAVDLEM